MFIFVYIQLYFLRHLLHLLLQLFPFYPSVLVSASLFSFFFLRLSLFFPHRFHISPFLLFFLISFFSDTISLIFVSFGFPLSELSYLFYLVSLFHLHCFSFLFFFLSFSVHSFLHFPVNSSLSRLPSTHSSSTAYSFSVYSFSFSSPLYQLLHFLFLSFAFRPSFFFILNRLFLLPSYLCLPLFCLSIRR